MRCPFCGHDDTQVKDSRPTEDGGAIRRRRFCANCGQRFTTIERVQLRELTVVKSDGRRVPFDRDKLARSIRIALRKRPIQEERIERIVNGIVRQLEASGESDIPSKQIGELVMETLKELDTVAYVRFASVYRNFREAKDFEDFIGSLGEPAIGAWPQPSRAAAMPTTSHTCARPWRWRGAASAIPGPTRRSAASSCATAAWSAAPSPRPAAARTPSRRRWPWPGAAARGATAYVTLEPCCHRGRTPPCTDALIAAGVARVVVATRDPDPRVNGAGHRPAARRRHRGRGGAAARTRPRRSTPASSPRVRHGRPLVTLKLATTLDGRIATRRGESRWITGEPARRAAHALRGRHDAVMVGVGTVLADDPDLTCRIPGFRPTPLVRVVADSHLRTPLTAALVATAATAPTWMLIRDGTDRDRRRAFADAGVEADRGAPAPTTGVDLRRGAAGAGASAASPACWWRAARSSPRRCCAPIWWTASPGSMRPR